MYVLLRLFVFLFLFFAVGGRMRFFGGFTPHPREVRNPLSPSLPFFLLSAPHHFSIPGLSSSSLPSALYLFLFLPPPAL